MSKLSLRAETFTELVLEVFRANRLLLDAGDDLTEPVGLSSARWQVLGVVEHGPIPVAHVARIMGLTRQSVQQTADGLEADGLIVYSQNPHHRRAKLMTLTPKGRQALDYVEQRHAEWANQLGEQHPLEALQIAVMVLRQIRERLDPTPLLSPDVNASIANDAPDPLSRVNKGAGSITGEITIPILPCRSINETLDFYRALGFAVTYQQAKPNTYAVVCHGGIELHFFSMREFDPAQSYSTCYVRVPDVDELYQTFVASLRQAYGRLPSAGIPRVIPLKNKAHGVREFIVVDPGGNWIRIGQVMATPAADNGLVMPQAATTKLARATHAATLLADVKGDYAAAATTLDAALAHGERVPATHRVQALVFRAGLAITMGDLQIARRLLADVRQTPLQDDERTTLSFELERAADLEQQLQEHHA